MVAPGLIPFSTLAFSSVALSGVAIAVAHHKVKKSRRQKYFLPIESSKDKAELPESVHIVTAASNPRLVLVLGPERSHLYSFAYKRGKWWLKNSAGKNLAVVEPERLSISWIVQGKRSARTFLSRRWPSETLDCPLGDRIVRWSPADRSLCLITKATNEGNKEHVIHRPPIAVLSENTPQSARKGDIDLRLTSRAALEPVTLLSTAFISAMRWANPGRASRLNAELQKRFFKKANVEVVHNQIVSHRTRQASKRLSN